MSVNARLFNGAFEGRRVLITGHTGFKGSWLAHWLLTLGAAITGYALTPDTSPSLFEELGLARELDHHIGDIRDARSLAAVMIAAQPEMVFHLAAQPLVRRSYQEPHLTFETNVIGTVNLLEAVRACDSVRVVVNVTTDKVYENPETGVPFAEDEPLGGHDPYSASKACSELVTASYRRAFLADRGVAVATARAGNVIGGGDWAADRLVPDCARALASGRVINVRNPESIRPWQHVLESLSGYLHLVTTLMADPNLAAAYNFGPEPSEIASVAEMANRFVAAWGSGSWEAQPTDGDPHEAGDLRLDTAKAQRELGWKPTWGLDETITRTARWYQGHMVGRPAPELVADDLGAYHGRARETGAAWVLAEGGA